MAAAAAAAAPVPGTMPGKDNKEAGSSPEPKHRGAMAAAARFAYYQEEATSEFTHNGKTYALNPFLRKAHGLKVVPMAVARLVWVLVHSAPESDTRVARADPTAPLLITRVSRRRWVVIDGLHRLANAQAAGLRNVPVKKLPRRWFQ